MQEPSCVTSPSDSPSSLALDHLSLRIYAVIDGPFCAMTYQSLNQGRSVVPRLPLHPLYTSVVPDLYIDHGSEEGSRKFRIAISLLNSGCESP